MPRPIIHSRDHEHGGADPVRILWESDDTGSGGSGGVTLQSGFYTGTNQSISSGGSVDLPWQYQHGDAVLGLTTASAPTAVVDGIYAVSFNLLMTSPVEFETWTFALFIDSGGGNEGGVSSLVVNPLAAAVRPSMAATYYCPAGGIIRVNVTNSGATKTFKIQNATVAVISA